MFSQPEALGVVYVTGKFLENFSGDQVRFLARSFGVPGNHLGQQSHGFRWPYGPANPRMTLFTGSSKIVDKLAYDLNGRIKVEDAGFDWKILRPDVHKVDYVSWVCDQDAYASIGQKCLTQSLLFVHENWKNSSLMSHLNHLAGRRTLDNLTIGSVLRVSY
ncbi:putative L-glutamate gamma-semialdehyde dehydrogenase [Helianthus annuus]|nr:putative L-glutamate gamma-semialdehyde dehydrogenase [Helianthus annuus]